MSARLGIASSRHCREAAPMKYQQNSCLNKMCVCVCVGGVCVHCVIIIGKEQREVKESWRSWRIKRRDTSVYACIKSLEKKI